MRDVNGSVLSIYVQNLGAAGELFQYEVAVYGSGRLGMYRPLEQASYYELKDHLGNVRVVIGGSTSVDYLATMETYRDSLENPYFEQNKVVTVADHLNHTPDSLANKAVRINNVLDQEPNAVGSGITLRVFPGDTLRAEVFAKYEDFDNTTNNIIPTLAGYLGTVFGVPGVGESPVSPFDVVDDPSFLSLEAWNQFDDQQPRLYLNYLLYDNNFNLVDFGFDQISEAARIPEDTALLASHTFEKLMLEVVAEQAGFVYIYVSNENDQNVTAYFDDLGVEHTYGNIAVATDWYPFGLAMAGRELERVKWRYGYQGDFAEEDEETGWNYFELRMYDPVIGRWTTVDPKRVGFSPYIGMGNSPINLLDPDGGSPLDIIVTNSAGDELFRLDDGKTEITFMTASDLYDKGIQWFSPKADNYMPLISISPNLTNLLTKNFEWSDIAEFSAIGPRSALDFLQGGSGDWKAVEDGADGYFLITVGGKPYWSDAIGQIPYAVWAYKQFGNVRDVVNKGVEYGEGKLFGEPEIGNGYDMYWVLRGALYARERYHSIGNNMWQERPDPPSPTMLSYPIKIKIGK